MKKLVELARKVNPNVIVATTRKTHPGMRYFEIKAVKVGGGVVHRNSLSDSILITQNHLRVIRQVGKLETLRKVELEPRTVEEAIKYAEAVDVLLFDHFSLEELKKTVPKLRSLNPSLVVAVAGDINLKNITEYAKIADIIITSAPYYAKPLNLTTKIERK